MIERGVKERDPERRRQRLNKKLEQKKQASLFGDSKKRLR
jgi:hypothetical protein